MGLLDKDKGPPSLVYYKDKRACIAFHVCQKPVYSHPRKLLMNKEIGLVCMVQH